MTAVPKLHDYELTLVDIDRTRSGLTLLFSGPSSEQVQIAFQDVVTFRITDMQPQNVVFRIQVVRSAGKLEEQDISRIRWLVCQGQDEMLINEQQLDSLVKAVETGELTYVYVEPSWGAEIGVLAGALTCST